MPRAKKINDEKEVTSKKTTKVKVVKEKKVKENVVKIPKVKVVKEKIAKTKTPKVKLESTKKSDGKENISNDLDSKQPQINIGMIGHVDHGKTSLTKALTGKWCDTHSEEMKRGISIRLGYADATFYKLKTPAGEIYSQNKNDGEIVSKRIVSFVDAPGHETLMTTMLSGAALMNGAVLVVAANEECPQPRTIEHLMALRFAGVKNIVVAQNKVDLVSREEVIKNYNKIQKFLKEYNYENTPVIPTSANFNVNIDLLIDAIETHIVTPKWDLEKPLKMYIARSFDINKPGTEIKNLKGSVLGGSISQGVIKIGDEIEIYPGIDGKKTTSKVISLSTNFGLIDKVTPGGLIAIGTNFDPAVGQNDRLRGKIVAKVDSLPPAVKDLTLKVTLFERLIDVKDVTLKQNEPVVLTIGTNTGIGYITKSTNDELKLTLKNEEIIEKGQKIAISKNIAGQWRLVAYGVVM
ncbi:MAG: translation initiation factor IF-2 subunit gamma [Candidatus ainarchaeum sp.]|nr:translation initiation factor IF-2 subunit gamma [Candidatus ainarchaeum sp.]